MRQARRGNAWLVQLFVVVMATSGLLIDAMPAPLFATAVARDSDDASQSGQDDEHESPDAVTALSRPLARPLGRNDRGRSPRVLSLAWVGASEPDPAAGFTRTGLRQRTGSCHVSLPISLCRLIC